MKKIFLLILLVFVFPSCSVLLKDSYLGIGMDITDYWKNSKSSVDFSNVIYSRSSHFDRSFFKSNIGNDVVSGFIFIPNTDMLFIGPPLVPVLPGFLFKWMRVKNIPDFLIGVRIMPSDDNIGTIKNIIVFDQNGNILKHIIPYEYIKEPPFDAKYDSISGIYMGERIFKSTNQIERYYECYLQGKNRNKIKELTIKIIYITNDNEEITLPPLKYFISKKLRYVPLILGS